VSILPKKKVTIPKPRSFNEWLNEEAERTGKDPVHIVEETFKDGWLTFAVEESTGKIALDSSQMFKAQEVPQSTDTWKRLREEFAPVSACADYIRDTLLGSGLKVVMKDKDSFSKDLKEYVEDFLAEVYQDDWKIGMEQLLAVLIDDAIVYGAGAAEICYSSAEDKPILFEDYVENFQTIKIKGPNNKEREVVIYNTKEPDWKTMKGIRRLKLINDGYKRLKLYRDPQSWLSRYWTLDEMVQTEMYDEKGMRLGTLGKNKFSQQPAAVKLLPWQVFWLPLNQRNFSEKGNSMIAPVASLAMLLEKIMKAVGEGIHRAGNKKYFIVCGTEKRQWSEPYIRNMIQELKEAAEKNWSTIPVPSGFDVKEIGGTIFEAADVVEYFLKIIAHGMRVPAKVVGLPTAKIEVNYNYERMRNEIINAVKRQLVLRHIWCEYGKSKNKQGGKGETTIDCPDIRFKTEGLLNEMDRLKMNVQLLNVANPISPTVKLEVEKSICDVMGWDENQLPTQDELKKQMEEMDKALKEKLANDGKNKPEVPNPLGKEQGQPKPQNEEMLRKRQEAGVNVRKTDSKKGKSRNMGGTRIPAESVVQESETVEESEQTNEPQKVEITVKTEPQKIVVETKTPLDEHMKILAEAQRKLAEQEETLAKAKEKATVEESANETERIQKEIEKTQAEIKVMEAQIGKIKTETEETKKTHEKKRKLMDKIEEDIKKEEAGE
jgi:hypothetical protein